jgi:hypothetical protein
MNKVLCVAFAAVAFAGVVQSWGAAPIASGVCAFVCIFEVCLLSSSEGE